MIAFLFWLSGFGFTMGYGWNSYKKGSNPFFGMLKFLFLWPVLLGEMLREHEENT